MSLGSNTASWWVKSAIVRVGFISGINARSRNSRAAVEEYVGHWALAVELLAE